MGQNTSSCIPSSLYLMEEELSNGEPLALAMNNGKRRFSGRKTFLREPLHRRSLLMKSRLSKKHSQDTAQSSSILENKTGGPSLDFAFRGSLYKETYCKKVNFMDITTQNLKEQATKPLISSNKCCVHSNTGASQKTRQNHHASSEAHSKCPVHEKSSHLKQMRVSENSFSVFDDSTASYPHTSTPKKSTILRKEKISSSLKSVRFSPDIFQQSTAENETAVPPMNHPPPYKLPPPPTRCDASEDKENIHPALALAQRKEVVQESKRMCLEKRVRKTTCKVHKQETPVKDAQDKSGEKQLFENALRDSQQHSSMKKKSRILDSSEISQHCLQDLHNLKDLEPILMLDLSINQGQNPGSLDVCNARDAINKLEARAEVIVEKFGKLLCQLDNGEWTSFCTGSLKLCAHVQDVLADYGVMTESSDCAAIKIKNQVTDSCNRLIEQTMREKEEILSGKKRTSLLVALKTLGEAVHKMMEYLISEKIMTIVESIKESTNKNVVKSTIATITELGLSGELMCDLLIKCGGIRAMISVALHQKAWNLDRYVIHAMSVLCTVPSAMEQFHSAAGMDYIASLLTEENENFGTALSFLAQLTAFYLEVGSGAISRLNVEMFSDLEKHLAVLAYNTQCNKTFLLVTAILANLSFLGNEFCELLCRDDILQTLITASLNSDKDHIHLIQDQVVTILANLAAVEGCRLQILESSGISMLLQCFQTKAKILDDELMEISNRIQLKSALALTRLCEDSKLLMWLQEINGMKTLKQLCKVEYQGGNTDELFQICLAALQKSLSSFEEDVCQDVQFDDATNTKLGSSFNVHSLDYESYV